MTTDGDTRNVDAENQNKECHVWVWGSSQMGNLVHKDERAPSLVESPVNTPVRQFESQPRVEENEPEHALSLILDSKGQVLQFHLNQLSLSPAPKSLIAEKVLQIACGTRHCAAVGVSGSLFTWGLGQDGELGHGSASGDFDIPKQVDALKEQMVAQVSCGSCFTVALTRDSAVFSWGGNDYGRIGNGTADTSYYNLPHKIDHLDGESVNQVVSGQFHVAAKTTSGAIFTWGYGASGCLGHGDNNKRLVPTFVEAFRGKEIVQLSCGAGYTAAVTQTGLLYTFGENENGQLGIGGNEQTKLVPTLVEDLGGATVLQVSCGEFHTIASTSKGVYTWGFGEYGQLGHGTTSCSRVPQKVERLEGQKVSHVVAFRSHTAALVERNSLLTEDVPLAESLRDMVNSEAGADLKFILEDGQVVFAHSCILCRRSDYFKSMLSSGMRESVSDNSPISIPDIRKQVFLLLLEYIYTSSVRMNIDEIIELYMLADMHGLKNLKVICRESMEQELNAENAGTLLQGSASSNCEGLKKVCMDFFVKNAASIYESGNMNDVTDVSLRHEIIGMVAGAGGIKRQRRE